MFILSVILGILMIICGVSCMCTPLMTFLDAGWFIVILVAVYGVGAIIKAIAEKEFGLQFVFGILSVLFGVGVAFFPNLLLLSDFILLYMAACWFIIQGAVTIAVALNVKKLTGSKMWILQFIMAILAILLGIYSMIHPAVLAMTIGILIGIYFVESGFSMIVMSAKLKKDQKEVKKEIKKASEE